MIIRLKALILIPISMSYAGVRHPVWSYVERPPRQELFQTFLQRERCGSYVRPFCAVIDRWPR
jgi:hypothetical protein